MVELNPPCLFYFLTTLLFYLFKIFLFTCICVTFKDFCDPLLEVEAEKSVIINLTKQIVAFIRYTNIALH